MSGQNVCLSGDSNGLKHSDVVVMMVPFPAHGHVNQLLYLSHLISSSYGIEVHFAGSTAHNHQAKVRVHNCDLQSSENIHFHDFTLPPFRPVPPNANATTHFPAHLEQVFEAALHLRRPVYQLLQQLSTKFTRVIIIHDNLMASVVQDVRLIRNAESYTFMSVSAFTIFFSKWESMTEKPFQLDPDVPTCIPSREGCFTPEFEKFIVDQHKILSFESGRLFNTSRIIEGRYMELLTKLPSNASKKLFAIGPFNPVEVKGTSKACRHRCLEWLDKQEKDSVLYVSFGTITSMSDEQVAELAIGLETSEQKFIWVLKEADKGYIFGDSEGRIPRLPDGYEQKVRSRGMVVRDWAPQLEILAHPATGGFLSHCGWSSCMESITMGVPIAAWPMHSDQPRNSSLVTRVLRIGTLVRNWADRADLVTSVTVQNVVRRLMTSKEGEEMRKRAVELGGAVRGSVSEGGSSRLELEAFIAHIIR